MKAILPYFALVLPAFALRTIVLGGIGGYQFDTGGISGFLRLSRDHSRDFFLYFFSERSYLFGDPEIGIKKETLVYSLLFVLLACGLFLNRRIVGFFRGAPERKALMFFLSWLSLPVALLLATRTFSGYQMYFPSIAFSVMLAFLLVNTGRNGHQGQGQDENAGTSRDDSHRRRIGAGGRRHRLGIV